MKERKQENTQYRYDGWLENERDAFISAVNGVLSRHTGLSLSDFIDIDALLDGTRDYDFKQVQ